MITNPGFSFVNTVGKHKILPCEKTDLPIWGPLYENAIVCVEPGEQIFVYSDDKPLSKKDDSVALRFASIDINNYNEILNFCDNYGMLSSEFNFSNFRNSYIFFEDSKDAFAKRMPILYQEREWLIEFQRSVITMRLLLELDGAIKSKNIQRISEILCSLCLDMTCLEFENDDESLPNRKTETYQYRHSFTIFSSKHGYKKFSNNNNLDISKYVLQFANELVLDVNLEEIGFRPKRQYLQFDYPMWHHLTALFYGIAIHSSILINPLGSVSFSIPFKDIDLSHFINEKSIVALGRAALSDIFKEHLHRVFPEIEYSEGKHVASWRIPSLLDAMYLELFFRFSPVGEIRKCADPKCNNFFEWSPSKPNQKYCDNTCALRAAKRSQRAREREKRKKPKLSE